MDDQRFKHRVTVGLLVLIAVFIALDFTVGAQLLAGLVPGFR